MNRTNPHLRQLAERLVVFETGGKLASTGLDVCERLRPPLATLMGHGGFRALMARALALAEAEVPWLRAARVNEAGAVEGLAELHQQLDAETFFQGRVELLTQLLGLLVTFIGENLTVRLAHEAWPKVPLDAMDFKIGGKNEKTK
jgi:hypothetical protein